ncbi:flagellar biosynthesis protein FlhF [Guyparkeria hydrothermalis]|uniref:flagellar biosynthesis protein FlhF n=1 Tax=Guyparkeria hydrothermalis TaxID=923 RepID=UPI0020227215|nr:flagellar biosynthesis protein FlhF [Guyparkeria hydrothermalis]MCL7752006.1 flagellar biosynthesis protein FlhF [Guyparkeria hydrothermalis]
MKIKRIIASDMREAMRQVRRVFGDEAVILSNKPVSGGVEVIAAMDFDEKAIQLAAAQQSASRIAGASERPAARTERARPEHAPRPARPTEPEPAEAADTAPKTTAEMLAERSRKAEADQVADRATESAAADEGADASAGGESDADRAAFSEALAAWSEQLAPSSAEPDAADEPAARSTKRTPSHWDWLVEEQGEAEGRLSTLTEEVAQLRDLFERQLSVMEWHRFSQAHPAEVSTVQRLQDIGLPTGLARELGRAAARAQPERAFVEALKMLGEQLEHRAEDPVEAGGVYAFVGPTGVGKTTTLAKLAARSVLHRGRDSVALISTDRFRIGAQEQLRNYARILNVPLHIARDETHLAQLLEAVSDKHLVLIDTSGMSQRDFRMMQKLEALMGAGEAVKLLLVLSANAQYPALEDVKKRFAGLPLHGTVLTKLDETVLLGGGLAALVRPLAGADGEPHRLPLVCAGVGQRVPEDLWFPKAADLIKQALEMGQSQLEHTDRDDPLWMLNQAG